MRVTLLGGTTSSKTRLAEKLRSCGQPVQVFTPDTAESPGCEDLTFLLAMNGAHANDARAERLLRSDLDRHHISYQVLYGTSEECLTQALYVIRSRLSVQAVPAESRQKAVAGETTAQNDGWVWPCDKCSDPACEHRLLSGLLASRNSGTTEQLP